jgi:hypothetical protein
MYQLLRLLLLFYLDLYMSTIKIDISIIMVQYGWKEVVDLPILHLED